MEIYDCLDENLDVWGHHFLEASAGTGKTFTIEHVTVRLLLDPKAIDIDQILIVTFTRAATRELKIRLQRRLRECLQALVEGEVKYPYLDYSPQDRVFAIQRLELALSCFDKAQIYTIHAFCHRMLAEGGFESGSSLSQPGPDDQNYQGFLQMQTKDFMRTGLKQELFYPSQIERALQACGGNCDKLASCVGRLIDEDSNAALTAAEMLDQFNQALSELPLNSLQHIREDLETIAFHFKGVCDKSGRFIPSVEEQIELLSRVIFAKQITMDEFDALIGEDPCLVLQLKEENRRVRGKDQPLPALHGWIEKKLSPLFEEATDPKRILQHMAALCSMRIDVAKTVHDIRPPDDILLELNEALDRPAFAEIARKQFQAAIVDEFQDTDPVQWSIFQKLFMTPGKEVPAFYLVGDPKQSIYAFRKADLYTYLNASKEMGRENRKMLCTNYRSSKQLIEALNTLFGHQKAGKWLQLPSSTVSIDYQPLLAHVETEPLGDKKKAIHILKIEDPNARSVPSKELEEQVLFPYIASQINALGLDFSAFAVLIKDRYQAMRLAAFFKRHGVPFVSKSGASVCASKAYLLLDALLPAMIRPNALGAVKRLLSAPIIAWEYPQLLQGSFDDKMQEISAKLHFFKAIWEKDGFAALIEEVLAYGFGHDKSLRELLAIEKENYVDYTHLCELLLEEEGKRPHSCRDLYQVFRQLNQMNPDHHPQLKQREVHESSAVTIMTTHMSKGLEFDVVFALGMACRHSESDNQELEAEKLRLFYVAMTRAKRRVYLPVIRTPGKSSQAASPAEKFFANWEDLEELNSPAISVEVLDCPIKCPGFTPKVDVDIVPPLTYDLSFQRRSISSYSGLVTTAFDTLTPRQSKSFTEFNLHTLPAGSSTGTLLHHLLEKVIENGLYQTPSIQSLSAFIQGKLSDLHPWSMVIAELIFQVMHLSIDGVCLKDIPPDAIAQEMEFLLPLQPDLMIKGFADLIFQFGGKTYIVDWKSNWLGPTSDDYSHQNLEKAMEHHDYFLQARIYGAALVQWLKKYETKPPKEFYGGAFYVFLRGINNEETRGIYHFRNY